MRELVLIFNLKAIVILTKQNVIMSKHCLALVGAREIAK